MKQIQWYPGHMAKAKRLIEEKLKIIDVVYELVDARIPESSRNPMMDEITHKKDKILIINKTDLADPSLTKAWMKYYDQEQIPYVLCNSLNDNITQKVYEKTMKVLSHLHQDDINKGKAKRNFKAMVIGVPNVGKSQFINNMAGKNKVKTGNMPGVTKTQTFIKAEHDLLLFDNPGVLWPRFQSQDQAFRLALMGTIKDEILPLDEVVIYGIEYLRKHYPKALEKRYGFMVKDEMTTIDIIDMIGRKRGAIMAGNEIDYDRVFNLFLYDLRNGALGAMSFEKPQ
ncbi:ribosome biogenesis GTPase YlqF [Hujiaoplasma nucleasis]|uniref:Ribosome biogenesis GTPase A n=1 Tax=Hujiaoplasma nucleasis TaxID=2725268 RepID=A0A7L6N4R3_9MOLU|nr:ribosome biogenesis GTPase YlqF [Hujiaoplasma nucleasis]QLY40267.1 ribosome biogenesis GTPase YlqF [Hujiaoplasma nucleasis]